jgi:hypothetical protein
MYEDAVLKQKIDYIETIYKSAPFESGNYQCSSNEIEVVNMMQLLPRRICDPKLSIMVHDKDSKIMKLVRVSGWNVIQNFDAKHTYESVRRS